MLEHLFDHFVSVPHFGRGSARHPSQGWTLRMSYDMCYAGDMDDGMKALVDGEILKLVALAEDPDGPPDAQVLALLVATIVKVAAAVAVLQARVDVLERRVGPGRYL